MVHEKHLAMKRSDARPSGPARLDDPFITEDEELQERGTHRCVLYNTLLFWHQVLSFLFSLINKSFYSTRMELIDRDRKDGKLTEKTFIHFYFNR